VLIVKLESGQEIQIPLKEIEFSFVRSSGPGGQNVNKVNSKAVLRWDVAHSPNLGLGPRLRFLSTFANKLTSEGILVLSSDRHRDQGKNVDDCLGKLRQMIFEIALPPKPRKKTRPTKGSQRRREQGKRAASEKKASRGKIRF
jgi:ribosome-associated protein